MTAFLPFLEQAEWFAKECKYSRILISARIRSINAVALTDFALIEQSNQYEKNNLVHTSDFENCAKPPWRALPDAHQQSSFPPACLWLPPQHRPPCPPLTTCSQSPMLLCPPLPRRTPTTAIEDCVPYPRSLYG